jgi:hypothetical protein
MAMASLEPWRCGSKSFGDLSGLAFSSIPLVLVMAGLVPAIHEPGGTPDPAEEDGDHRDEPGDDDHKRRQTAL